MLVLFSRQSMSSHTHGAQPANAQLGDIGTYNGLAVGPLPSLDSHPTSSPIPYPTQTFQHPIYDYEMSQQCAALTTPNTNWSFCPNKPASYLFAVLFGLTFVTHVIQMIKSRKWYCWVIAFSAAAQFATYVVRTLSILNPANEAIYALWFVLILIAPIFTNAFVYMALGRAVYNFTSSANIFKVRAWYFGLIFVLLDITALIIQVLGATVASASDTKTSTIMLGLHIYMIGIGFQQLCILVFLSLAGGFHAQLKRQPATPQRRTAFRLLYVVYGILLLITIRIIFRIIEYSDGLKSSIPQHEAFQYVLDSTPMLIALVLLNVIHPGTLMKGKESDMPSRKQRKVMKKEGVVLKGRADEYLLTSLTPYRPESRTMAYTRMV
ncbi:hypothetical protein LTR62_003263 [Meristemomyces frigidus]|uniref:Uncharacterized protein n=1 Tax=Meristemomyces frigidus TaxID=1508187 RepID=A0AAN7TJ17_9PEZI|nr:hypothetical protein LTR62_003263 [Meristemomyces frigidus]